MINSRVILVRDMTQQHYWLSKELKCVDFD